MIDILPQELLPVSHERRRQLPLSLVAAVLLAALLAGCATIGPRSSDLSSLRGQPVLVVAELGEAGGPGAAAGAAEQESALARALALVPLRIWPGSADPALRQLPEPPSQRLSEAREAAEVRRVPWLLVRGAQGLRLETARGAELLWKLNLSPKEPLARAARGLSRALRSRASGAAPPAPLLLRSDEVRLAEVGLLNQLRELSVAQRWQAHRALIAESLPRWPADPALRIHDALTVLDAGERFARLRLAHRMNPDGESELLALALMAEAAGQDGLALRWREQLLQLFPDRIDYRPELADRQAEHDDLEGALSTCRSALGRRDGEQIERLPRGTAPHEAPSALPFADLRFATGWYLALSQSWELAAHNYLGAEQVYATLGRPREQSDALNNAGVAMVEAGRPLAAAVALRRAARMRSLQGAGERSATSRYNLARALADAGRLAKALRAYQRAEDEYLAVGAERDALETGLERLAVLARAGDEGAFEDYAAAFRERLAAGGGTDAELLAAFWYELGKGRHRLGRAEPALEAYTTSLQQWRALGRRLEEGQLLYLMASPHLALMRFEAAHGDLVAALEIAVELSDSNSILAIGGQLAELESLILARGAQLPEVPEKLRSWFESSAAPSPGR